ncbi:MAG: metallophosphoesterase family protein [Labilithrix sp.]|nr:metallophosphoesterase family protein [Labilithrix sp.]MCW5812346.1 metallophosphoesterase family protein [Labilithrix sp.]
MKVQYVSDVHIEFHADEGESFVESLEPDGIDVLVLAGDVAVGRGIGPALDRFCRRYADARVLYVHGNHEFYGTTREDVVAITREACARNPNLAWLDGDVVTIGGVRFLGAPMWFKKPAGVRRLAAAMNDFSQIERFDTWVYEENARALAFFDRELARGDFVVTHYLPAEVSVAPRWKGSALNPFFLCDVEALIRAREPACWVHGHTHDTVDAVVGATRVLANPFGYVRFELNPRFVDRAVVEID